MYVLCYYTLHSSGFAALPLIKFSSSTDHEIMLGATPDESVALQTLVRTSYRRHRFTMYVLCYYTLHLLGFATLPLIKFSSSTDHEIMLGATPDERVALQTLVRTAYRGTCGRARSPHNCHLVILVASQDDSLNRSHANIETTGREEGITGRERSML